MSWFSPTNRWPIPPSDQQDMGNIRETAAYAVQTGRLVEEIKQAFLNSVELCTLSATYHPDVEIALRISSSRKYTTFAIPHCPKLLSEVLTIFGRHNLRWDKPRMANHAYFTVEIGTLRIGAVNETIYFKEPT